MRDMELDRLKSEQDHTFARQQEAYQNKKRLDDEKNRLYEIAQNAWQRRSSARDEMNREYERMQFERSHNDAVWDEYKRIRDNNNRRIDALTQQADDLYQKNWSVVLNVHLMHIIMVISHLHRDMLQRAGNIKLF